MTFSINKRFMRIVLLVTVLFSAPALSFSFQTDDWINPGQPYWKFKVAEEGIYKITFRDLQQATNQDLGTMDPAYFKLYRLGKEEPLHMQLGGDGSFDPGNYMTFYGEKNQGQIDTGLFVKGARKANPYQSLYSDSAAYFLTWGEGGKGKRYQEEIDTNYNQYQPQHYVMDTVIRGFEEDYNAGDPVNDNVNLLELSYYTDGEGWTSNFSASYRRIGKKVATPGFYKAPNAPYSSAQIKLIGATKCVKDDGTELDIHHRARIIADQKVVDTYDFKGYKSLVVDEVIENRGNTSNINFNLWSIGRYSNQLNLKCDRVKIAYIKVGYPRELNPGSTASFFLTQDKQKYFLEINNYKYSNARIYDKKTGTVYNADVNANTARFLIPKKSQGHSILFTRKKNIQKVKPEKIKFKKGFYERFNNKNYLVISHKKLESSANTYAQFRRTESNYKTEVSFTKNLYNRFSYGQHHALGIKYFLKSLLNRGNEPNYLLLIGKGIQPSNTRNGDVIESDLVPTIGSPPTDNLFTLGLSDNAKPTKFAFPVGRIPASSNNEVNNYLLKLKSYRRNLNQDQAGLNHQWLKNFLHISGGEDKTESERYKTYLKGYQNIAEGSKYGASIDLIAKSQSIPSDKSQKDFVIDAINQGKGLVTYFGHGAAEILEVDIGDPEDYDQKNGNYPVFLFSGCIIGNSYTPSTSMSENFLVKNENSGGVAWMAESAFSFESYLDRYTTKFYQSLTNTNYGNTLGEVFTATADKLSRSSGSRNYINEMQIVQKTLHGDPALELFSPEAPDYVINNEQLSFLPSNPNTSLDSFAIKVIVQNAGKFVSSDSLTLSIKQQQSDLSTEVLGNKQVTAPGNTDTFRFFIQTDKRDLKGNNQFTVSVENRDSIGELNTKNNEARISRFFPSSGISTIKPRQYAIINKRIPTLKVQANDVFLNQGVYRFQIDTTPGFNSPFLKTSPPISGDQFGKWEPGLLPLDSTVYYWRAKKAKPDETNWVQRSFMYIDSSPAGWAQGHFPQFKRNATKGLTFFDSTFRRLAYDREALGRYNIQTTGAERGRNNPIDYFIRYEGPKLFYPGSAPGIYILAVNENEPMRVNYASSYNTFDNKATGDGTPSDTTSGVFHFNWVDRKGQIDTSVVDDFIAHITDSIPDGYTVLAFTARRHLVPDMPDKFYDAMASIGAKKINDIEAEWPYIILGEKGLSPGEATEKTADTTQPIAPKNQLIKASKTIFPLKKQGTITSSRIGPSANWQDAFLNTRSLEANSGDSVTYDIIGVDKQNNLKTLKTGLTEGAHVLQDINEQQYPYVKLRANLSDKTTLTPPELSTWLVHYDYLPEGSLVPQTGFSFYNDTIERGDELNYRVAYQNISDYPMDSVMVLTQIFNSRNRAVLTDTNNYQSLAPGDTLMVTDTMGSGNLAGLSRLKVTVNPNKAQPERYLFNNIFTRDIYVKTDRTSPALDVTFNGRYIKDNAILNPRPFICIEARDNNNYYFMEDTSRIDVRLQYPDGAIKKLAYDGPLAFTPAAVENDNKAVVRYKPQVPLPSGQFKLIVEAADATGNVAAEQDYEKTFRVLRETAVADFHAAPNPFTNGTRFQFLLKGKQVPDKMRIQIFSTRGELIRTISHDEIAPLQMGQNQTDYVLHRRSLSAGMYIYKVQAFIEGNPVPYQLTDERAGKGNRFGKLILIR